MKTTIAAVVLLVLSAAAPAVAQLTAPNAAGVSLGHIHLYVSDVAAQQKFWETLGGVPVATRNEVKQSRDLQEVLKFSLAFEAKAVEMYSAAIKMAEEAGDRPLIIFLEDILKDEQEGVDEYTKLLRDTPAQAAQSTTGKRNMGA